jgi:tetratricopeptide (TPR) repeat protein
MVLALAVACESATTPSLNQQANERYVQGDYSGALDLYREAQVERPELLELHYNAGNALHRLEQYDGAIDESRQALVSANSSVLAQSYYSVGNHYFRQQRLADALEAYKNALVQDPNDFDAKHNLEVVLALMDAEQPPNGQQPSPPPTGSPDPSQPPGAGQPSGAPQPTSSPVNGPGEPNGDPNEQSMDEYLRTLEEALRGIESEFGVEEALRLLDILAQRPVDTSRQAPPEVRPTYRDW